MAEDSSKDLPRDENKHSSLNQRERFLEVARALDCDEDEAAFDDKLKRIVRKKPYEPDKEPD